VPPLFAALPGHPWTAARPGETGLSAVWHYSLDGVQKQGPVSESELGQRLRTGEFPPDTLVWAEGRADWEPANKVAPFALIWGLEPPPEPPSQASSATGAPPSSGRPRPWIRFWARGLDLVFWTLFLGSFPLPMTPELVRNPPFWLGAAFFTFWALAETLLLSTWGTTPGKWLLRVQVEGAFGGRLGFFQALKRSFLVLVVGLGLGIPFVGMLAMLLSLGHLQSRGSTFWDRKAGCRVVHGRIDPMRGGIAVFLIVLFCYLFLVGLGKLPH